MAPEKDRVIVVAGKPAANYALAIAHRVSEGASSVTLRARGRHISAAFDAANLSMNSLHLPLERGGVRWGQENAPGGHPTSWAEVELKVRGA